MTQTQCFFQRIPLIATDESDFEVSGVFQGRERLWERPERGLVDGTGRLLIQGFVRTVVVVLMTKPIEADLLRLEIAAGGDASPPP